MFCLTQPSISPANVPAPELRAPEYLSYLQDRIKQKRVDLHKSGDPSIQFTTENGVLQFKSAKSVRQRMRWLMRSGFSEQEAADILFIPPNVNDEGSEWQRTILIEHESHLLDIAAKVQRSLFEHAENPGSRECVVQAAIGVADVPLLFPYVTPAPAGGAVIIIPRGMIIFPMWFAALRRLPRPWNEMPYEGEPLRRLLGAAGIAVKAMLGHTVAGTNSYMFELLHSEEMRIGLGGEDGMSNWVASQELTEFLRRHERTLCERFVIAHELAHVALGHPEIVRAMAKQSLVRQNSPEWSAWMRQAEFEADHLALQVLLDLSPGARSTMRDGQHVFSAHQIIDALLVLFLLFHVVENHKALAEPESSHPPALDRLRQLLESLMSESEGRQQFFTQIYPQIQQDYEALDEMLRTAIQLAKPKVIFHPDAEMRWLG